MIDTYLEAIADGRAVPGDPRSLLLVVLDPDSADARHREASAVFEATRSWVVDCDLASRRSLNHEPGIILPGSDAFHGVLLRERGYDFESCAECHGRRFTGGAAESSCRSCHEQSPTNCETCHRPEAFDASHRRHARYECAECHDTPASWDSPGHLDGSPAEVVLGGIARLDGHQPTWTGATCADTYCHGDAAPVWASPVDDACGTCHELPPPDHARDDCDACHQRVVRDRVVVTDALHVDGVVSIGAKDGCDGCHDERSGLHPAHLEPRLGLAAPAACGDCHVVPVEVGDAGHIDSPPPAEVFPRASLDNSLAAARGASPTYASGRCADVYCHGDATLRWERRRTAQVYCGSCHEIPPSSPPHVVEAPLSGCVECHASSVDGAGNIRFEGEESEHLDGDVDL